MQHRFLTALAVAAMPLMWGVGALAESAPPVPGHSMHADAQMAPQMAPQMAKEPSAKELAEWHKGMCTDRYAHEAGRLAYLQARLNLTEQQIPAWVKWAQIETRSAEKDRDSCLAMTPKAEGKPTIVDREAEMEKHLSMRLENLQASHPALQALYDVLTPEQRAILDRPHEGGPMGERGHGPMGEHEGPEGHHPLG